MPMLDEDLRSLALDRLADAEVLLAHGRYGAAYYLAGYVVECGLKTIIARMMAAREFPDKTLVNSIWTHDFQKLLSAIGAEAKSRGFQSPVDGLQSDPVLRAYWNVVAEWTESSRYELRSEQAARDMIAAITDPDHGVLPWIRKYW